MIPHTLACTSTQLHSSSLVAQGRAVLGKLPAPPPPRPLAPTHSSSSDVHQWEGRRVSPLSLSQGLRAHTPVSRRPLDRSLTLTTPTGAHAPPPPSHNSACDFAPALLSQHAPGAQSNHHTPTSTHQRSHPLFARAEQPTRPPPFPNPFLARAERARLDGPISHAARTHIFKC